MLLKGNCLDTLKTLPDNSIDSVVSDPPYELGFMGKGWDASGIAYNTELWAQVLRVLKPGGHLLAFSGSRTYHRMTVAIEDAGFEIRDSIHWNYGQGFPKSLNIKKSAGDKVCQCEVKWSYGTGQEIPEHEVRDVRSGNVPQTARTESREGAVLLTGLPEQSTPTTRREKLRAAQVRCGEPCVEGRSNAQTPEGELQRCEVCPLPAKVANDGSQGWVHHGTSSSDGGVDRSATIENGSGEPHQPQPLGQPQGELGTVPEQRGSQAGGVWPLCAGCGKPIIPSGLGTALKPSHEPICVARKPLIGTVAQNVLTYGTGALNIDGSRVGTDEVITNHSRSAESAVSKGKYGDSTAQETHQTAGQALGRWPANTILTHSPDCEQVGVAEDTMTGGFGNGGIGIGTTGSPDGSGRGAEWQNKSVTVPVWECAEGCPVKELDGQSGVSKDGVAVKRNGVTSNGVTGWGKAPVGTPNAGGYGGQGGASRFFTQTEYTEIDWPVFLYYAKASKSERNAGLEGLPAKIVNEETPPGTKGANSPRAGAGRGGAVNNFHPTVKPVELMRHLIRLVTPPGGKVLDPFLGSGTTAVAAILEGCDWVGCEMTEDYWPIIEARTEWASEQKSTTLF